MNAKFIVKKEAQMKLVREHSVELVFMFPDEARRILDAYPYKGQRPYTPSHTKFLMEEMQRGKFKPMSLVSISFEPDGKGYLVNGQHTLNAVILFGKPVQLTLFYYQSKGEQDTAETYTAIDVGKTRGLAAQLGAMRLTDETLAEFTFSQAGYLGAAAKFIWSGFTRAQTGGSNRYHLDEILLTMHEYAEPAFEYFEAIKGRPRQIESASVRSSTLGVGLVTYKYSKAKYGTLVEEFWKGAMFDDGVKLGDPRKLANRFLLTAKAVGNSSNASPKEQFSSAYMARFLAACFNAWVEGREPKTVRVDQEAPIKINGSPWKG